MPEHYTATASVATNSPDRYAKQLAAHLGRRSEVRQEPQGTRIMLAAGECLLRLRDNGLELRANRW